MTKNLYITPETTMAQTDFARISTFIHTNYGIKLPDSKKTMVEARLHKRMRRLGIGTFREYLDQIFGDNKKLGTSLRSEGCPQFYEHEEMVRMIDVISTNKTDFFREPVHFDFLTGKALPHLIATEDAGIRRTLKVWSAGCSTGEEPYTLAMVLSDFSRKCGGLRYAILATDISSDVLEKARTGIYDTAKIDPIPIALKKQYLLRSKDPSRKIVRIDPELRSTIEFRRLNLIGDFGLSENMDIIFCRNVIIYFDPKTQEQLFLRFYDQLIPGGFMFIGHSETLNSLKLPFVQVFPTVYQKPK